MAVKYTLIAYDTQKKLPHGPFDVWNIYEMNNMIQELHKHYDNVIVYKKQSVIEWKTIETKRYKKS